MKIRLIRTMIKEYEPDPEWCEPGMTIEQMAEQDANAEDLEILFEQCQSDEVKWEIIKDPL